MFRLSALAELEKDIAHSVEAYFAVPVEQRGEWLRTRFGPGYPLLQDHEILEDLVASEFNGSRFRPTFECPACGRLALADPPSGNAWVFYRRE